jgi:single-strand DNA-binding protein
MSGVNKVIILGNIGNDPEARYTKDQKCVVKLSIATSETWKDKNTGEKREETEWHRVVLFGKVAEVCSQYVKKGNKLYVEGKLKTSKWKDKETGQEKYSTDIIGDKIELLGQKNDVQKTENNNQAIHDPNEDAFLDDIPF